jgi:tetratricopeptide (TPR) repeat protein
MLSIANIRISRVVVLAFTILLTQTAYSQDKKTPPPSIDQVTGKVLNEAIEFLNQEKYNEAKTSLGALEIDKLSPYESSRVHQILATIAYSQGDFDASRKHMQAALDSGGMNEQEASQARYQIAQMYMAQEKWVEGAAAMELWIKTAANPGSAAYYLLAVAYYQQEKFDSAIPAARKAIELTDKPQESWLQLLLALILQKEQYKEAVGLLKQLIQTYPEKKVYWQQLSSVYGTLEDYKNALATLQIAYHAGLVTDDSDIRRLSDMMMVQGAPYRSAELLRTAIEKKQLKVDAKLYEKLANAWIAAREYRKSLPVLQQAAEMSGDGAIFMRIGEVNMQLEEWDSAAKALQSAVSKGGLKDTGNAQLLIGISYFNQKKLGEAKTWLQRATSSKTHEKTARGYLQLIESQQQSG